MIKSIHLAKSGLLSGILFCLLATPAFATTYATPAYVQSAFNAGYGSASIGATLSSVQSKDTVLVFVAWESSTVTLSGITDNCGGTYTIVKNNFVNGTSGNSSSMAYGTGSSGNCTITAAYSSNSTENNGIVVQEVSGLGALDQAAISTQLAGSSGATITSGNVTTQTNGEYIFGAATGDGGAVTFTQGSGFTLRQSDSSFATEDQNQTTAGTIAATFTSGYAEVTTGIMTFKPMAIIPPPSVPTGLAATAVSTSQINLSWTASTDSSGTLAGYDIYRDGSKVGTSTTASYNDTGLSGATTYTYTVSAYDTQADNSAQSTSVSATTLTPVPPSVPTGLTATTVSSSTINLTWTASTDSVGTLAGYKIYRDDSLVNTSTTTSYSDVGLGPSTTYTYTVSAYDTQGNNSAQSASASATTAAPGVTLSSGIIPAVRAADWTYAGIPGGVPSANWVQCGPTIAAYGTTNSPGSPAAINNAITACGNDQFVLLGTGDFYLNGTILLKSNVVLRGNGANSTRLHFVNGGSYSCNGIAGVACIEGQNTYGGSCNVDQWPCPAGQGNTQGIGGTANWTGGYAQGSTTITLDNVDGIVPNVTPITLDQCDTGFTGSPGVPNCTGVAGVITAATVFPSGGGSGYAVGDTGLINATSDFGRPYGSGTATYKVTSVGSGGAVTGFTVTNGGNGYSYTSTTTLFDSPTATTTTSGGGSGFEVQVTGITPYDNGSIFACGIDMICSSQSDSGTSRITRTQTETLVATSITGSGPYTLTLSRPIVNPNWAASQGPQAWWGINSITNSGIENLMLDMSAVTAGASGVGVNNAYKVWVKGITSDTANYFHINAWNVSNLVVRDSYFYWTTNQGTESYGIGATSAVGNSLFENNVIQGTVDPLNAAGNCSGCVYDYNYSINQADNATAAMFASSVMHSASSNYILHEGNIGAGVELDPTHGPHFMNTFYRNYYSGYEDNEGNLPYQSTEPMIIGSFSRYNQTIANVLGTPGYHKVYECMPNSPTQQICSAYGQYISWTDIFDLGWSHDTQIDYNNAPPNPNDPLTASSFMRWGNWDSVTGAVRWCGDSSDTGWSTTCGSISEVPLTDPNFPIPEPSLGDTASGQGALPASFIYASKPSWWPVGKAWPVIGPDVTSGNVGQCTGGTYSWAKAINSSQCTGGTFLSPASTNGSHVVSNPAEDCYFNVMGGNPYGTGPVLSFNASACYGGSSSPVVYGEVLAGDTSVTLNDAVAVAQYVIGLPVTINTAAAEVDGKSTVDLNDAVLIAQYVVGLIAQFPAQS